jgi:hypothetical protein
VERPEAVAAQLLSACGLDWDPAVLSFHTTKRSVQTASMTQVRLVASAMHPHQSVHVSVKGVRAADAG